MPPNYFVPNAIVTLTDRGDWLEARWASDSVNAVYPVGANQFLDRNFWARLSFIRDAEGKVNGFTYNITREFTAKKLGP